MGGLPIVVLGVFVVVTVHVVIVSVGGSYHGFCDLKNTQIQL